MICIDFMWRDKLDGTSVGQNIWMASSTQMSDQNTLEVTFKIGERQKLTNNFTSSQKSVRLRV